MDDQTTLLTQISESLNAIQQTLDEVNNGIGMMIEKNPESDVVDKLDDIAEGVGDINVKIPNPQSLLEGIQSLQQAVDDLPGEIGAAIDGPVRQRGG